MKLSAKVLFTVLSMGIAIAHGSQEHGFQRFLIEKDDRPSMANGLNRTAFDAISVQDMEEDGFARFLGEDGPDNSKGIVITVVVLVILCISSGMLCLSGCGVLYDGYNVTRLNACCGFHFLLMSCMLIFAGFFLSDAFTCGQCLYFAAGPEQHHAFSLSQSAAHEPIGVQAKGYTGTVGENLDKLLGYNARNYNVPEDISDNCGIWIFHPDQWKKLGQTIEIDATVGRSQISAGGSLSASRSDGILMEAMTSTKSSSDCKVSFGTDNKLRNYKDDGINATTIIGEGNCREVKYLNDKDKNKGQLDMETVVSNRNWYAIAGLFIFLLIRILQYIALFMVLGSDSPDKYRVYPDDTDGLNGLIGGCQWVGQKMHVALDTVFYTQMPMFMLEPLTSANFIQDCDAVLAFRFNPKMWIVAAAFSGLGVIAHGVDLCLMKVSGSWLAWKFIKIIIDLILAAFVVVIKIFLLQRFGLTVILGLTFKWVFNFDFWPLTISFELDMFQIFACLFQIWDIVFAIYSGYYKYLADEDDRKEEAGALGEMAAKAPDEDNNIVGYAWGA